MEELADILTSLNDAPANFAVNNVVQGTPLPGLHIEGVGSVSVPLCDGQAKKIIAVASKAPFGLGEKTVVDESYRKTWEIQPDKVSLTNPLFKKKVHDIVSKVHRITGITM